MAKGFNAPKMNQMGMMQKLQKMQEQLEQAQEQLANETVTHTAGGGAVKVVVTGDQRIVSIEIDAALMQDGDVEMLQDLILTAVNGGLEASRKLQAERMGPLAGGLPF
ncbi:MAG: nucleoid-associated protein, YbaB/EbfC family [Chloroflexi bacterium RBG_19FT_COMBO_56_12]|nr:MAG: nucleoid-associated protein, YbaB/EbfC family [Chloroflexi bacterium RBG_16_58_14]OGO69032.1 MAG: nucleoid-associated protein, YbaB/EbfC family [Chloroflexi bacterium RBG_19FT_COMBO_56_12]